MRYTSHLVVALLLLANVANVHAGWDYGGLKITSVRDNQTVSASSLIFTSGTILANSPSTPVTGTRVVTAFAGHRSSNGVYVPATSGSTSVNRFFRYWNVRLDGSRVPRNAAYRGFVYASSRYLGSSSVHAAAMVDGLTFR
jgi:hypothetical protein